MNLKFLILLFVTICLVQFSYSEEQQNVRYQTHVVSKGETVFSIARKYNLSVDEIYTANPGARSGIRENEALRVPTGGVQKQVADINEYILHSVQPNETLYSVSKKYNIPIEDIIEINPGLNTNNFRIGTAIKVPKQPLQKVAVTAIVQENSIKHKVLAKETLYNISKQYNLSMQEIADANPEIKTSGLKKDMILNIPAARSSAQTGSSSVNVNNTPYVSQQITDQPATRVGESMKIGLLLPFLNVPAQQKARFVEFYEGFLLALEDIKSKGYSAEVFVFDIRKGNDTQKLESLLETTEIKGLDLIIGGVTEEEVGIISRFAGENNIKYVVPFPLKNTNQIVGNNTYLANVPQVNLYDKVVEKFYQNFKNYNVIIAMDESKHNDKETFTSKLKVSLDSYGVSCKLVSVSDMSRTLKTSLSSTQKNIIVPASSSLTTIGRILPTMRSLKTTNPELDITMFGYPDWQAYSTQYLPDFFKFGVYIYTPFFAENNSSQVEQFDKRFRSWYSKTLINTYPKYGMLGYDLGLYCMIAMAQNVTSFNDNYSLTKLPLVQSTFYFEKDPSKGINLNTGLFFIHYNENLSVDKIDYSR